MESPDYLWSICMVGKASFFPCVVEDICIIALVNIDFLYVNNNYVNTTDPLTQIQGYQKD